ncbi:hypothetical protein MNODULE_05195 [Nitrospiraceae bacterium HYJII51-Mn-bac16s-1-B09]|uniref:ABC transporter substrate-binding protein n=1 Tax=Candidatus Manganitrophus noduliformans TaxID=2606439 RepID=A0A7X6DMU2_9BACT|nr:hypothetical protein [Candidatus Manganitrophus noduliformans]
MSEPARYPFPSHASFYKRGHVRTKVVSILIIIVALVSLQWRSAEGSERPIAILVGADIAPYQSAAKGAREALSGHRTLTYLLDESPDRMLHTMEKVSLVSPRAVIAIGSQAILALKANPIDAPVVFCLVIDHEDGLEVPQSWGISMHPLPREAYDRIRQVFPRSRIAIPYNPERTGALVEALVAHFRDTSIQLVPMIIRKPSEIAPVLRTMRSQFDALWLLPDGSFIDSLSARAIIEYSIDERLPILGFSEALTKNGAVLSVAGNYEDMGRQAAETARRVISGERPLRIQPPRQLDTFINVRVARILNLPVGGTFLAFADRIYPTDPDLRMP